MKNIHSVSFDLHGQPMPMKEQQITKLPKEKQVSLLNTIYPIKKILQQKVFQSKENIY
jgi:hypothetical protein